MRSSASRTSRLAIPSPLPKSTPPSSKPSAATPATTHSPRFAMTSPSSVPKALWSGSPTLAGINFCGTDTRSAWCSWSSLNACMRRSQQAFSAPSKQTQSSNAKDELSSTASINALSTTLIPSSELLASKPRDCTLKREQNSCYEHDNGLNHAAYRRGGQFNDCPISRAESTKSCATGLIVRFFKVMIPTGQGGTGSSTGTLLNGGRFVLSLSTESGIVTKNSPFARRDSNR